jgi:hypothetical protein
MTFARDEEAFPERFLWLQNTGIPPDKVPAHLLPFGNLLVMMKPQSLELQSIKNRFGGRRFDNAGQGCRRLCPKAFANERIRGKQGTGQISRIKSPNYERRPGIKLMNRYVSATPTQRPKNQESIFDLSLDPTGR